MFVGDVHQYLRALTRLGVFKGDVVVVFILSDIAEVKPHSLCDVDGAEFHSQRLAEQRGVPSCARRRTEAGHRHSQDVASGAPGKIHPPDGDEQRQAGVQTARYPDDGMFCV